MTQGKFLMILLHINRDFFVEQVFSNEELEDILNNKIAFLEIQTFDYDTLLLLIEEENKFYKECTQRLRQIRNEYETILNTNISDDWSLHMDKTLTDMENKMEYFEMEIEETHYIKTIFSQFQKAYMAILRCPLLFNQYYPDFIIVSGGILL